MREKYRVDMKLSCSHVCGHVDFQISLLLSDIGTSTVVQHCVSKKARQSSGNKTLMQFLRNNGGRDG